MADALAISAAVVQFLDIAVRLTLQLSSLYKQVQDVPEKLQHLQVDIDQQITIARYVQSTHATFWNASPSATVVSMSINQPLADYVAIMEQLLETVKIITKPSDTGIIRRSWSALRATQKCKEAITLCDAIEKKKSNINMWLSTANLELSSEILRLVNGVDKKIDQTLQLSHRLEEASKEENLQSSRLPAQSRLSANVQSTLSQISSEASSSQRQILTLAANTEANVRTITEQWKELSPTFQEFRNILQHSSQLQQHVRQVASNARCPSAQDCEPHVSGDSEAIPKVRLQNACTCRDIVRATSNGSIPFLQFRKIFRQYHFRYCPRWKSSATSLEYLVKIIPPTWLLAHTFHLGFCVQFWNSKSSWKISPLVIGGSRRVDPMQSPAFQAIRNLKQSEDEDLIQPKDVQDLQRTLHELFDTQQASVYDEDNFGNTLLFEIMHFYEARPYSPGQDPLVHDIVSLIRFLLDCGSDPNIHRAAEAPGARGSWYRLGGTILDIFAVPLMCQEVIFRCDCQTRPLVYSMLLDSNAYFSQPLADHCGKSKHPVYHFKHFKQELKELKTFEDQLEVCNLTDLMIAIIRRVDSELDRAIAKDSIHKVSNANGLTAIHFAIFWPTALRKLIAAGADVNSEDRLGRRPIHLAVGCGQVEAIFILLEADCSLRSTDYPHSLLQESLSQGREFDHVTQRVIDALIDRHTRLANLASSMVPDYNKFRKEFRQGCIVERDAPSLLNALAKCKYRVAPALDADRHGVGVYDTANLHADIRLTTTLADQLWNGGFRRINRASPWNNLTPLLQSWFVADFDMVSWFIEKGASPFTKRPVDSHNGLHLFAARMAYPGAHFYHGHRSIPCHEGLIKQLTEDENMWHDSCRCICSPKGCTPISIAVKQCYPNGERNYEMMLDLSRSLHEKLLYRPEEDLNHIKQLLDILVFEKLKFRHTCCRIGQEGELDNILTFHHHGKTVYDGLEADYQQSLKESGSKMLQCGCDIIEKPACVVFREKCKKGC